MGILNKLLTVLFLHMPQTCSLSSFPSLSNAVLFRPYARTCNYELINTVDLVKAVLQARFILFNCHFGNKQPCFLGLRQL